MCSVLMCRLCVCERGSFCIFPLQFISPLAGRLFGAHESIPGVQFTTAAPQRKQEPRWPPVCPPEPSSNNQGLFFNVSAPADQLLLVFSIFMPRKQLVPWQPGNEQVFTAKRKKTHTPTTMPLSLSLWLAHKYTGPSTMMGWWKIKASLGDHFIHSDKVRERETEARFSSLSTKITVVSLQCEENAKNKPHPHNYSHLKKSNGFQALQFSCKCLLLRTFCGNYTWRRVILTTEEGNN